jgi:CRP-like cAMP-binding protein
MSAEVPTVLPATGVLAELSEELRTRLSAAGEVRDLPRGAYLVAQGDSNHELSVLLTGRLLVSVHAHGDTRKLAEVKPGETVGEMNIIDPAKASADVVVAEPSRVWSISARAFGEIVESDPKAGFAIMRMLARELCRRIRHNSDTMLHQAATTREGFLDRDY